MTMLKICGLMNESDIRLCAVSGADILGFVTNYPNPVPWNLSKEQTKKLLFCVPKTVKSCIVTGGKTEDILSLASELLPDYIQLHYRESFEETTYLAKALLSYGIKTIKAVPIKKDGSCEMPEFSSAYEAVAALSNTKITAILIDSRCAAFPSARSRRLDVDFCRSIVDLSKKPIILSGGVTGETLGKILKGVSPCGVDILTGTEDKPGQKSKEKIAKICRILRK